MAAAIFPSRLLFLACANWNEVDCDDVDDGSDA